jgi:hypothetical protein
VIHRACYVICDGCHTPAQIATSGAEEAREIARSEGFTRKDEKDLCPHCSGRTGFFVGGRWVDDARGATHRFHEVPT